MNPVLLPTSTSGQRKQRVPSNFKISSLLQSSSLKDLQLSETIEINGKTKTRLNDLTTKKSLNELLNLLNDSIDRVINVDPKDPFSDHFHLEKPSENQDSSSEATLDNLIHLMSSSTIMELESFADVNTKESSANVEKWESMLLQYSQDDQLAILMHPDVRPTKEGSQEHWKSMGNALDRETTTSEFLENSKTLSSTSSKRNGSPQFSNEIWRAKKDISNEIFLTCPPELIEIYSERGRRRINRSDNFWNFSTESFETSAEWSSARSFAKENEDIIRTSRSLATNKKGPLFVNQVNFEDEIWPTSPRILSSKDFHICISGISPEIVAAEKLENHSRSISDTCASALTKASNLSRELFRSSVDDEVADKIDDMTKRLNLAGPLDDGKETENFKSKLDEEVNGETCLRNQECPNMILEKNVNLRTNEDVFDETKESRQTDKDFDKEVRFKRLDLKDTMACEDKQHVKINKICLDEKETDLSGSTRSCDTDSSNVNAKSSEEKYRKLKLVAVDSKTGTTKCTFNSIKKNNNLVKASNSSKEQRTGDDACVTNLNIVTRDSEKTKLSRSVTLNVNHDTEIRENLKKNNKKDNFNDTSMYYTPKLKSSNNYLSKEANPTTNCIEISTSEASDSLNNNLCFSSDHCNYNTTDDNSSRKSALQNIIPTKRKYRYESNSNTDSRISVLNDPSSRRSSKERFTLRQISSVVKATPTISCITSRKLDPLFETSYMSNSPLNEVSYEVRRSTHQTNSQSSFASSWKSLQGDNTTFQERTYLPIRPIDDHLSHFGPVPIAGVVAELEKRKIGRKMLNLRKGRKMSKIRRVKVFGRRGKVKNTKRSVLNSEENLGQPQTGTDGKKIQANVSSGTFAKSVDVEELEKKIDKMDQQMTKLFEVESVLPSDVCQILTEVDDKLRINRELTKRIVQFHLPNSNMLSSTMSSEAAKLLATILARCNDYIQSHDCSWEAVNRVNELLSDAAVDVKKAVDDQTNVLKSHEEWLLRQSFDCVRKSCNTRKTTILKNAGKQRSSKISTILEKEKEIEKLILNMLRVTRTIVPKAIETRKKKKSPRSPNSLWSDTRNVFQVNNRYQTECYLVKSPKMNRAKKDIDFIETHLETTLHSKNVPNNLNNTTMKSKNIVKSADVILRTNVKNHGKVNPRIEDRSRDIDSRLGQRTTPATRSIIGNFNNSGQLVKRQKNPANSTKLPAWRPAGNVKIPSVVSIVSIDQKTRPMQSVSEKKRTNALVEGRAQKSSGRDDLRSSKILEGFQRSLLKDGSRSSELVIGQKSLIENDPRSSEFEVSHELLSKDNRSTANSQDDRVTRIRRCFGETKPRQCLKNGTSKELTKVHRGKSNSKLENSRSTVKFKVSSVKSNRSDAVFSERYKEKVVDKNSEMNLRKRRSKSRSRPGMPNKSKTKILEVAPQYPQGVDNIASEMSEKPLFVDETTKKRKRSKQSEVIRALKEIIKESSDNVISKTDSFVSDEKIDICNSEYKTDVSISRIMSSELKMGTDSTCLEESVDCLNSENNIDSSSTNVDLQRTKSRDKIVKSKDRIQDPCEEEINVERSIITDKKCDFESSVHEIFKKRSIKSVDFQKETDLSSVTNVEESTIDSRTNVDENESYSEVQFSSMSVVNVGCAAEFSSSDSTSRISSAMFCQASLMSLSSSKISQDQISKKDGAKIDVNTELILDSQELLKSPKNKTLLENHMRSDVKKPNKTFFNRHTRSVHLLKEILSLHGLDIELLNKAERDLKLRQKKGTKNVISSKDFVVDDTKKCSSKLLFNKLDTLLESENNFEDFHSKKTDQKSSFPEDRQNEVSPFRKNVITTSDIFDSRELDTVDNASCQMLNVNRTFIESRISLESIRSEPKENEDEEWSSSKSIGIGSEISIQCEVSLEETREADVRSQMTFELHQVCDMCTETEDICMEKSVSCPEENLLLSEKETSVEIPFQIEAFTISELSQAASTQTVTSFSWKHVATEYNTIPCSEVDVRSFVNEAEDTEATFDQEVISRTRIVDEEASKICCSAKRLRIKGNECVFEKTALSFDNCESNDVSFQVDGLSVSNESVDGNCMENLNLRYSSDVAEETNAYSSANRTTKLKKEESDTAKFVVKNVWMNEIEEIDRNKSTIDKFPKYISPRSKFANETIWCSEDQIPKDIINVLELDAVRAQNPHRATDTYKENLEVGNEQKREDRKCNWKKVRKIELTSGNEEGIKNLASENKLSTALKDSEDKKLKMSTEIKTAGETVKEVQAVLVTELFKNESGKDSSSSKKINKSTGSFKGNVIARLVEKPIEISHTLTNEHKLRPKVLIPKSCDFRKKFEIKTISKENLKRPSIFLFSQESYLKKMKDVASGSCEETTELMLANSTRVPLQDVHPDVRIFVDILLNQVDKNSFPKFPLDIQVRSTRSLERCKRSARKSKLRQTNVRPYDNVFDEKKTIWKLSFVSRENLLSLVYAAVCAIVFCCLQFTVSCNP